MTLAHKTTVGILWKFSELLSRSGIQMIVTLLLARFLLPEDFGLLAMMTVFLAVAAMLMESGFRQALIRMRTVTQKDCNTAFYANLALGSIAYVLLFISAPFIAHFYNEPRLVLLIRTAGAGVLINAFQLVQSVLLSRELDFKAQLKASLPAVTISGVVAVVLAYMGAGVWALIIQILLAALITTILLWILQGWRPTLAIDFSSLWRMYNFGYKLFLADLSNTIFLNLYFVVIAKIFTAAIAGYYFFAARIRDMVLNQLVASIQVVTYPALSIMQDDDIRLKSAYRKIVCVTTFLLFPAMLMLAALAEPLFDCLLPPEWHPAVLYLQLLCLAGVLYPLHVINLNIITVKGRSGLFLYLEIIRKVMFVVILVVSIRFGIFGVLVGQIINSVLAYIPNSYFTNRLIDYTVCEQLADFMPGLILAFLVAMACYSASHLVEWSPFLKLLVFALSSCLLYVGLAHLFGLQAYTIAREVLLSRNSGKEHSCEN